MFNVEMLPAYDGDALWVEYGHPEAPSRILIDCGYKATYRAVMERLRGDATLVFELLVLTHIDSDHINGAIPLIADSDVTPARFQDVWFNGRDHLVGKMPPPPSPSDALGGMQGEYFTDILHRRRFTWNAAFDDQPVVVPTNRIPAAIRLPGGMRLTLLSPGRPQLAALAKAWDDHVEDTLMGKTFDESLARPPKIYHPDTLGVAGVKELAAVEFEPDDSPANGSSIAFLAEYDDVHDGDRTKRVLFAGDAFSPVLRRSLETLLMQRGGTQLKLDAFKISHHGSKRNTSRKLLELVRCRHFLISTKGSKHGHPDQECIARIIDTQQQPEIHFNYFTARNEMWKSSTLKKRHGYRAHYPPRTRAGCLRVSL